MATTSIEWTDVVWNPSTGCDRVSAGCDNCYAATLAKRWWPTQYPPNEDGTSRTFEDVRIHPDRLDQPLRWRKPRRVFVNSVSDLFHVDVSRDFIAEVFAVMALAKDHTFQILTKRPGRMALLLASSDFRDDVGSAMCERTGSIYYKDRWPLPNVWLGVSVENQHYANTRIPELLRTPAAIRFLSCEPLLEHVDLSQWVHEPPGAWVDDHFVSGPGDIDWVIVGGESGPRARPFEVDWARSLVRQCRTAGVACFVKQLGANVRDRNDVGFDGGEDDAWDFGSEWPPDRVEHNPNGWREEYQGAPVRVRLHDRKGGDIREWPELVRVREMPAVRG